MGTKIRGLSDAINGLKIDPSAKISPAIPRNITSLKTALDGIGQADTDKIRDIASSLESLAALQPSHLASYTKQLAKLPELSESLEKMDIGKFADQMKKLSEAMKPFADEMAKVSSGFSAFPSRIQRLITSTEQYNGTVKRATRNTNSFTFYSNATKT